MKNSIAAALDAVGLDDQIAQKKGPRPKYMVVGKESVPHFYGGHIRRARKQIRALGPEKAAAAPRLAHVKVVMVEVRHVREIDRSKYTGARLRKLRAKHGIGKRPKTQTKGDLSV